MTPTPPAPRTSDSAPRTYGGSPPPLSLGGPERPRTHRPSHPRRRADRGPRERVAWSGARVLAVPPLPPRRRPPSRRLEALQPFGALLRARGGRRAERHRPHRPRHQRVDGDALRRDLQVHPCPRTRRRDRLACPPTGRRRRAGHRERRAPGPGPTAALTPSAPPHPRSP